MNIETDFLVIGSGIAGLSYALKAAEVGKVVIVTKGEMNECNTDYAQGGIASVMYDPDTFEKHIRDTLVCGAGICDRAAVEQVVTRAPEVIKQLIASSSTKKAPDAMNWPVKAATANTVSCTTRISPAMRSSGR